LESEEGRMAEMTGRVCLITGSTNGIGRATAEALARQGASVILHGRNIARLDQAVTEIKARTGNANVSRLVADLSSLAEVRALAAEINALAGPLHVLINNAGVLNLRPHTSNDGFELQFAVNHLAHFLLTNLVLDKLKASGKARIVVVASRAHYGHPPDPARLEDNAGLFAYGRSKFANVLFARELARRLAGSDVTANALHPGVAVAGRRREDVDLSCVFA
jgi:NAD(P)-dependent dehydrogenase (short-subunit alcohol dehydrogenase family)